MSSPLTPRFFSTFPWWIQTRVDPDRLRPFFVRGIVSESRGFCSRGLIKTGLEVEEKEEVGWETGLLSRDGRRDLSDLGDQCVCVREEGRG